MSKVIHLIYKIVIVIFIHRFQNLLIGKFIHFIHKITIAIFLYSKYLLIYIKRGTIMDFSDINAQLTALGQAITEFFKFLNQRLNDFKNITLGEQISFGAIVIGIIFILISIFLFIL
jgi:hypothetical protein